MAVYGDLTFDSRVRREAATLADAGYDVILMCLANDATDDLPGQVQVITHRPTTTSVLPRSPNPFFAAGAPIRGAVRRVSWLRDYVTNLRAWGRWAAATAGPEVDAWHLHDLTALAAVLPQLDGRLPVVYDAHELFLDSGTARRLPTPARRLLQVYERRLVSRVSAVVTVNDALAEVLTRRYSPARIIVLHNAPDPWEPPPRRPTLLRDLAGIPSDEAVILYHGNLAASRGIEELMQALLQPGLERAHLVLLGFGQGRDEYQRESADPRWGGRLHVLDPVSPATLLDWVASADVCAMPIQASTLNHYLSTPNKMFESLAAGVPVVASDFPTMRRVVMDDPVGPLGAVCDPASVADVASALRAILELDPDAAAALRARCLTAAKERWNWRVGAVGLIELYGDLVRRAVS